MGRSLSIGLLHFTAPPVVGGVETIISAHARLLLAAGHRVHLIVGRGGVGSGGVAVARIPRLDARHPAVVAAHRALDRGERPPGYERLVEELAAEVREACADLDLLVAHNVCSLPLNLPLTAALRRAVRPGCRPRLVAWTHDIASGTARYAGLLHAGEPWDLVVTPWPDAVQVTISEARRAEIAGQSGLDPAAIRVVPNGLDAGGFLRLHRSTVRLVRRLGLAAAGPILLTPARVTPRKNLELAITVLAALRAAGDDARVIITGAPDPHGAGSADGYLADLRALARATGTQEAVHFLVDEGRRGHSNRVVADLFRVSDALFLPSHDEGFGLPILEAAACRLPVICAAIPSLRELAGADATYFEPGGDPAAIAAAVRTLLRGSTAYRLARRVRTDYAWDAIFTTLLEPLLLEAAGPAD